VLAFFLRDMEITAFLFVMLVSALMLSQLPFIRKNYIKYKRVKALHNKDLV